MCPRSNDLSYSGSHSHNFSGSSHAHVIEEVTTAVTTTTCSLVCNGKTINTWKQYLQFY